MAIRAKSSTPASIASSASIEAVRSFQRFFTQKIGVLHEHLLQSEFSLTEVRVLFELAHRSSPSASEVANELGLDAGYLSRILQGFQRRGLIQKKSSDKDGRQTLLTLTPKGYKVFAPLNERSSQEVQAMLAQLSLAEQKRLLAAMDTVQQLLSGHPKENKSYLLRQSQPGDMGWVVQRHGELYAAEYRWNEKFEGLVANIVADFVKRYDAKRERCWIAERSGENVGCIFLVRKQQRSRSFDCCW